MTRLAPILPALMLLLALAAPLPGPGALAQSSDREARRDALFAALDQAGNDAEARTIEDGIWRHWFTAPDAASQALMDRALERRGRGALAEAVGVLDELVTSYPEYAEGWNQRATLYFMQGRYDASLADIDRVMALEPRHFGALSGKAVILMRKGQTHAGQSALQEALRVNPWLRERRLLLPEYREEKL